MRIAQALGAIGTALVIGGYLPQVRHLIKEHCSAGLSLLAFALWSTAALLFLLYALVIHDTVFVVVQSVSLVSNGFILMLTKRYEGQLCPWHRGPRSVDVSDEKIERVQNARSASS